MKAIIRQLFSGRSESDAQSTAETATTDAIWEAEKAKQLSDTTDRSLLYHAILDKLHRQRRLRRQRITWATSAAAAVILLVTGYHYLQPHTAMEKPLLAARTITKTAGKEEVLKLVLPDSSVVLLNAGASVSYPERFNENNRQVALNGEAFFDVKHDPDRPFSVRSGKLNTMVLGTSFTIRAYPGDNIHSVTVASGKVKVENGNEVLGVLLPNQQIAYNNTTGSHKMNAIEDLAELNAWQQHRLIFKDTRFSDLLKTLERWYGIEVEIAQPDKFNNCIVNTRFRENASLQEVLGVLQMITSMEYKISNNKLSVRGRGCDH